VLGVLNTLGMPETGYVVSAGICYVAALWRFRANGPHRWVEAGLWFGLALLLVALVVFKAEDVQVSVANEGRELARSRGWYGQRRELLEEMIYVIGAASMAAIVLALVLLGDLRARLGLTVLSAGALLCFVAVRTLSLHKVDVLLYRRFVSGVQLNVLIESTLVTLVGITALLALLGVALRLAVRPRRDVV
jgi:hypothetical protein